jgi:hypothetical protein
LSEKQIPQVVENLESGGKPLERSFGAGAGGWAFNAPKAGALPFQLSRAARFI